MTITENAPQAHFDSEIKEMERQIAIKRTKEMANWIVMLENEDRAGNIIRGQE